MSTTALRSVLPDTESIGRVSCRFVLQVRDLATAAVRSVRANFLISCHGVHGRQLGPADHGVPVSKRFRGTVTLGGRSDGVDSAVGTTCVNGKALPAVLACACAEQQPVHVPKHAEAFLALHKQFAAAACARLLEATLSSVSLSHGPCAGARVLDSQVRGVLQDVVVLGGGAFACEAMREAVRNGARTVTTVTRHNTKCACMGALGPRSRNRGCACAQLALHQAYESFVPFGDASESRGALHARPRASKAWPAQFVACVTAHG